MQAKLPDKKQVMDALLTQASSVFVHLDPRREKVVVPPQFRKQPMLVLEIGMNMRVPIPDLEIDEEGVGCTLSFGGRPYWCQMPWHAVFALVTSEQRGMVWPPDVPPEVADRFAPPAQGPKPKAAGPRLVPPEKPEEEDKSSNLKPLRPKKSKELPPAPDADGNAAAVLEPPQDPPEESPHPPEGKDGKSKRKLPSYLRVVK